MKNIGILMMVLMVWFAGFIRLVGAETNAVSPVLVNDTFDEWDWQPMTFSMMAEGRKVVAAGGEPAYEYEGPLFREAAGFFLPAGRMVEGPEAYKGRSMLIDASRGRWEIGMHDHYGYLFDPGKTYTYEVALKGKFIFQGWVSGVNPATAEAGLFQNGIGGGGGEFFLFDGHTSGYEGYLPEVWNFLMAAFTRSPEMRKKLLGPVMSTERIRSSCP